MKLQLISLLIKQLRRT